MEECSNNGTVSKRKTYHTSSCYYYSNNNNSSKNNTSNYEDREEENNSSIRKGPWKPEEDKVLLDHVHKYGPRDWSSIRSNGFLQRTGKSCRLRWVNKLRPNLKIGCKFTAEEEKVVIDMQAQLGNKWATIAKHLPGRTDNDVKNFWSSRQKRLARILHSPSSPRKKLKSSASIATTSRDHPRFIEAPRNYNSSMGGETSSRTQPLHSLSHNNTATNTTKAVPTPGSGSSMDHQSCPSFEANNETTYLEPIPLNINCNHTDLLPLPESSFPSIPCLQQTDLLFPLETQELIDRIVSSFLSPFGCAFEPQLLDEWNRLPPGFGGDRPETPDSFTDDLPSDMFDQLEPLPSP